MDSDTEYANTEKVTGMSIPDYLKRLQEQLKKKPEVWENKTVSEIYLPFPANVKGYQENFKELFKIHTEFLNKNCKDTDKSDDKAQVLAVSDAIVGTHQTAAYQVPQKVQGEIVAEFAVLLSEHTKTTTEEGTVGCYLASSFFGVVVGFYQALQKKSALAPFVEPIKNTLKNSNGQIDATCMASISSLISYMNMNAKGLLNENVEDFWQIGIKLEDKQIIGALGQSGDKLKKVLPETFDKWISMVEDDNTLAMQNVMIFDVASQICPDKLIEKIDYLGDFIETPGGKYYGSIAMKNLAKKYPDRVFTKKSALSDLCEDGSMGFQGCEVFGAIGKFTKDEGTMDTCIQEILKPIEASAFQNLIMAGMSLKEIATGGDKQKELFKGKYASQIEKLKTHSDAKLAEQIQQLLDVCHGRNLETLDKKIDDLKAEMLDYINSRMDDITANYNDSVKKLPMPVDIHVKKSVMNTIFLKFECAMSKDDECEYPGHRVEEGEYFKTKTKEVNKWVKVGCSVVSLGKSVMAGDVGGALGSLAETFGNATSDDQGATHFKALLEEPFLTSSEQDRLILQLREANYFHYFSFDPKFNGWVCHHCKPFERKAQQQQSGGCKCSIF